ncbi:hypothetical protein DPMN_025687 [Dreissena polymorpha]|uniref:Uncharacterized protein n=1 Tax=Dreissena polymorpha TaxID=45954 RepID=A0A9D4LRY9_DREPO|nr:hypothetical protein DPMN_025687 [Dreissena polymorpha]
MDSRISDATKGIPDEKWQQPSADTPGRRCFQTATSVDPGCGRRASATPAAQFF